MKKTTENKLIIPTLTILALNGPILAADLADELKKIVHLYPHDKEKLENRNVTNFEQTVSNLISHRKFNSIAKDKKLVTYTQVSGMRKFILSITPSGRKYLQNRI